MHNLAALLGGIGLFLVGIKGLGTHLQSLAGRRLRGALAWATRGPAISASTGLLLGALTQSSSAATFILTGLVQAGALSLRRALPIAAFANPGTAGLVLLATVDIRFAVLWLIALVGLMSALNLDRDDRLKPALGALLGLGLMFLGLDLMKTGAAPLSALHDLPRIGLLLPFVAGAAVTLLAQSSSTVSILALTLHGAGVLSFEQAALAVYGASLGSGGAVLLLSASVAGAARRLAVFQALLKAAGVALALLLFAVEHLAGIPLLLALAGAGHIGLLFLILQSLTALCGLLAPARTEALLRRLCPDSPAEALSRPHFLYDRALDHPAGALDLVALEQCRLAQRLPGLVDPLRAEPDAPAGRRAEILGAGAALEKTIAQFLAEILARGGDRRLLDRAVTLEAANAGLAALHETLGAFGGSVDGCRDIALRAPLQTLAESLHLLLGQLAELADGGDTEDATMLRRLTDDRSEMMDGLRRRLAAQHLPTAAQSLLYAATAQFERAVWLVRRQALLMAPQRAG